MLKQKLKKMVAASPLGPVARATVAAKGRLEFSSSDQYWESRYKKGGNSGAGSYGRLADFKAEVLNAFVERHGIATTIEFGSGDGNQVSLATYPHYVGVDVAETAVEACKARFADDDTRLFVTLDSYDGGKAELALSLDVIYHLVEDSVFEAYMETLFDASERFVIVYASNKDEQPVEKHVRHRAFTDWVTARRPAFKLVEKVDNRFPYDPADPDNTSFADFYIFERSV